MHDGPHRRGDDAQGAEYWRREADRLQLLVMEMRDRIDHLTEPMTLVFQGVEEDGTAYERSIIRIPEERWESEVERFPYLGSWDWTATAGICFLLSPVTATSVPPIVAADAPSRDPVARDR